MPPATTSASARPEAPASQQPEPFLGLTLTQVLGSGLAAATSALAASFLGVAGTIIGALVGSLIATVATAVYAHSLNRAGTHLREVRPRAVTSRASARSRVVEGPVRQAPTRRWKPWAGLAAGVVAAAALALGGVTALEAVIGHPISDSQSTGTSIAHAVGGGGTDSSPAPQAPSPAVGVAPGEQPSAAPTPSATAATPTETATTAPVPTQTTPSAAATSQSAPTTTSPSASTTAPAPTAPAPAVPAG